MTIPTDPLAKFAVPGVIEARQKLEKEAAEAINKEFPHDQHIAANVNRIFEAIQYQNGVIDLDRIMHSYRAFRAKEQGKG